MVWSPQLAAACGWMLWIPLYSPSIARGSHCGAHGHGTKDLLAQGSSGCVGLSLPLSWQGGPGQDDLQHHVHQGEPSPLSTSAWRVPAAQQTHHLPRWSHLARRSVNPIPASQNCALGHQPCPCCLLQSKGDSPVSVTCSSLHRCHIGLCRCWHLTDRLGCTAASLWHLSCHYHYKAAVCMPKAPSLPDQAQNHSLLILVRGGERD